VASSFLAGFLGFRFCDFFVSWGDFSLFLLFYLMNGFFKEVLYLKQRRIDLILIIPYTYISLNYSKLKQIIQ